MTRKRPGRPQVAVYRVTRFRPPRPLVGLALIERVLDRHTAVDCGEARLVVAVITRAIGDCLDAGNARLRRQARRFLLGRELEAWCDLVGLEADFVRLIARKAGYLVEEAPYLVQVAAKPSVQKTKQKREDAKHRPAADAPAFA
ncbi:MAG: hypothetical protein AB1768_15370 [Pseudomonadota bacterium]